MAITFVEPRTGSSLVPYRLGAAEEPLIRVRSGGHEYPMARSADAYLRSTSTGLVYPVVDGVPILLRTEALRPSDIFDAVPISADEDQYRSVYDDLSYYDKVARLLISNGEADANLVFLEQIKAAGTTPAPEACVDAPFDGSAQARCFQHLTGGQQSRILQVGGSGTHVLKLCLYRDVEGLLITPILGEALYARNLARQLGIGDRFDVAVGIAEELPFEDNSFSSVYSHGCVHHTVTRLCFAETRRILAPGGRFAAVDPMLTPLYKVGVGLFGKRDPHVACIPLDRIRIAPLYGSFSSASVERFGAIFRYPALALSKTRFELSPTAMRRLRRSEDALSSRVNALQAFAGSVALLGCVE